MQLPERRTNEDLLELLVVVPCFNHGRYLDELVDSIRASRTSCRYAVCIVDDASTDDSWEVIERLQRTITDVRGLRLPTNRKTSAAMNAGIAAFSSRYVVCVGADDRMAPNYIHQLWRTLKYGPADVAYADSRFFGAVNQRAAFPEFDVDLLRQRNYVNAGAMFRRRVWELIGGFDENMRLGYEDWDFWLRAARAGFTFRKCGTTEYLYRISGGQSRNTEASERIGEVWDYLARKHGAWLTSARSLPAPALTAP